MTIKIQMVDDAKYFGHALDRALTPRTKVGFLILQTVHDEIATWPTAFPNCGRPTGKIRLIPTDCDRP